LGFGVWGLGFGVWGLGSGVGLVLLRKMLSEAGLDFRVLEILSVHLHACHHQVTSA